MLTKWQSLTKQKLFLSRELLTLADTVQSKNAAARYRACLEGALALTLEGRSLLLTTVAAAYQKKDGIITTLSGLAAQVGDDSTEYQDLMQLARIPDSWWSLLNHFEYGALHPPKEQKSLPNDNIIAIAIETTPQLTIESLSAVNQAMTTWLAEVCERHSEW